MADLSQSKENDAERIFLDFLEAFVGFIVIFLAQSSTSPFPMQLPRSRRSFGWTHELIPVSCRKSILGIRTSRWDEMRRIFFLGPSIRGLKSASEVFSSTTKLK
jgi:hypothetical protein